MNRLRFAVLLFILSVLDGGSALAQQAPTLAIAAQDDYQIEPDRNFRPSDGLPPALALAIAEALSEDGRFEVVERAAFRRVIEEQNFDAEHESRFEDAVRAAIAELDQLEAMQPGSAPAFSEIGLAAAQSDVLRAMADRGDAAGARFILMGSIDLTQTRGAAPVPGSASVLVRQGLGYRLRVRLIDSENATLVGAASFSGGLPVTESGIDWTDAARFTADFVRDSVYPLRFLSREPFIISRGSSSGLAVGDTIEIVRLGAPIRDGGIVLGRMSQTAGTGRVVSVEPQFAVISTDVDIPDVADFRPVLPQGGTTGGGSGTGRDTGTRTIALGRLFIASGAELSPSMRERVPALRDGVERRFVGMPGVEVADRGQIDRTLGELQFQSVLGNTADLSRVEGADWLVFGEIDALVFESRSQRIEAIGRTQTQQTGRFEARFEVVDAARGIIVASTLVRFDGSGYADRTDFEGDVSAAIASAIADVLFPPEIIGSAGADRFYVSHGSDRGLALGAQFDVVDLGEEMIDSAGRNFGRSEMITGRVRVVSVEHQRALVELESGHARTGQSLRLVTNSPERPLEAPARIPDW